MTTNDIEHLRMLEGRRVGISLTGGRRIDDCQLVSAARSRRRTVWVFTDGEDAFVPLDEVVDLWEVRCAA